MKSIGSLAAVLLVSVAALAPGAAGASQLAVSGGRTAQFAVAGTNGFHVEFTFSKRMIGAAASKGPAIVSYTRHSDMAEAGRFAGTLPGIGRVSVRFHPHGRPQRLPFPCPKSPTVVQPGYFVGTIRLRGEKSYTRVQATRAQGTVSEAPSAKCASQRNRRQSLLRQSPGGEEPPTLSILATAGNVGLIGAQTAGSEKSSGSLIAAFHTRHHDGMVVKNAVLEFGSAPVILPTEDVGFPESATVQPPKPFSGSANFAVQNPHAASWTGDLAVELPGIGEVRLAGPSFKSEICLAEDCRGSLAGSGLAGL